MTLNLNTFDTNRETNNVICQKKMTNCKLSCHTHLWKYQIKKEILQSKLNHYNQNNIYYLFAIFYQHNNNTKRILESHAPQSSRLPFNSLDSVKRTYKLKKRLFISNNSFRINRNDLINTFISFA